MAHELELKLKLADAAAYRSLKALLDPPDRILEQLNYYLDDERGSLLNSMTMLRVRVDGQRSVIAIKSKLTEQREGYFQMSEDQAALPHPWRGDLVLLSQQPLVRDLIQQHRLGPLKVIGTLANQRQVYPQSPGYSIELDRTRFSDGSVEYEVEVETADPDFVRQQLQPLFVRAGIEPQPQNKSKYQRFLERCQPA